MDKKFEFGHERLDCYRLAVGVARWAARQHFPAERKHLRDQLLRAADSVTSNIAEGSGCEPGAQRRHHYRVASGSAAEACSVLDVIDLLGGCEKQQELRRVGAMLSAMCRA
jgi:four helix bundle protein